MPNYSSRNNDNHKDELKKMVAGAFSTFQKLKEFERQKNVNIDENFKNENKVDAPKKPSYDNDLYRDAETNYQQMFAGALKSDDPHSHIINHHLMKIKPHEFWILRHTAKLANGGALNDSILGDKSTWSPNVIGAVDDISNSRDLNHLTDMVYNDKLLGGNLTDKFGFVNVYKNLAQSLGKTAVKLSPMFPKLLN
jgi:hypothetical protein